MEEVKSVEEEQDITQRGQITEGIYLRIKMRVDNILDFFLRLSFANVLIASIWKICFKS